MFVNVRFVLWAELRHNDFPVQPPRRHIATMAGDSETLLKDRDENATTVRPFLIGVSGGTASGKVGPLVGLKTERSCQVSHLDLRVGVARCVGR